MKCFSCDNQATCDPQEGGIFNTIDCPGICFIQYLEDNQQSADEYKIVQRGCYDKPDYRNYNTNKNSDPTCNTFLIDKRLCSIYCDTNECNGQENDPTMQPLQEIASLVTSPVFYGFLVFLGITICILCTYLACTRSLPCCADDFDDESRSSAYTGNYQMGLGNSIPRRYHNQNHDPNDFDNASNYTAKETLQIGQNRRNHEGQVQNVSGQTDVIMSASDMEAHRLRQNQEAIFQIQQAERIQALQEQNDSFQIQVAQQQANAQAQAQVQAQAQANAVAAAMLAENNSNNNNNNIHTVPYPIPSNLDPRPEIIQHADQNYHAAEKLDLFSHEESENLDDMMPNNTNFGPLAGIPQTNNNTNNLRSPLLRATSVQTSMHNLSRKKNAKNANSSMSSYNLRNTIQR